MPTAIVIIAYNRAASLRRLLASLAQAHYPQGEEIPLCISIDKGDNEAVIQLANDFHWAHGPKKIIQHPQNLGLRQHILQSGALTAEYGSIIMLEDDLLVSPAFYEYAHLALSTYGQQPQIAGMALYSYRITEGSLSPFLPLDTADAYLMQLPCSWGQAWTYSQWAAFVAWYQDWDGNYQHIPTYIRYWSAHSWKKIYTEYLLDTQRYFIYPRASFSTNTGAAGMNVKGKNEDFEVPLCDSIQGITLPPFGECMRYDANFELAAQHIPDLGVGIPSSQIALDLHGSKTPDDIQQEYVLTSQKCRHPIKRLAKQSHPVELDVLHPKTGKGLSLCHIKDFKLGWLYRWHNRLRPYFYTRNKLLNKIKLRYRRH